MILSRDTYANNKHLVGELLDTSLHRGGASVRRQPDYFEDGGTFAAPSTKAAPTASTAADNCELVQLLRETRDAILAFPDRQHSGWEQEDTVNVENALKKRANDRKQGSIR